MSQYIGTARIADVGQLVRAAVLSPVRRQTYLNLAYLLLAFPLGILYFTVLVTGLALGVGLSFLLIGVPILLSVLIVSHLFAALERKTARRLLSIEIESPGYPFLEGDDVVDGVRSLVASPETYLSMCYLGLKFVIGMLSFMLLTFTGTMGIALVLTPLYYDLPNTHVGIYTDGEPIELTPSLQLPWNDLLVGVEYAITIVDWEVTTLPEALAVSVVGVVFLVASLALLNAFARVLGLISRLFLSDVRSVAEAVRSVP